MTDQDNAIVVLILLADLIKVIVLSGFKTAFFKIDFHIGRIKYTQEDARKWGILVGEH